LAFRVASRILPGVDWAAAFEREVGRYGDGEARLGGSSDERQRQLTRMGNAAWGAALSLLMQGKDAGEWLERAAERWRESYAGAPAGSWGRPIGAIKALVLAEDRAGAEQARIHADAIRIRDDFPREVGDALAMIAAADVVGYVEAVESVLESFETRDEYLEDVPVADTVLVLQALAARRGMAAELDSPLLPGSARGGGAVEDRRRLPAAHQA